jgi:hypothetical protein
MIWDGKDDVGVTAAAGKYTASIINGSTRLTRL